MAAAKVLIRGTSGAGKTSLVNQALMECGIRPRGLRSVRYFEQGQERGYNLLALSGGAQVPLVRGEPLAPKRPQEGFFEEVALPLLEGECSSAGLLLVDEIGRFEKHSPRYLNALMDIWLDAGRPTIFVLKKEPLPFNDRLWEGAEYALRIDCDEQSAPEAGRRLCVALAGKPPVPCFVRMIVDGNAMENADAFLLMDRLSLWLQRNPGKGLGIVCGQDAQLLHAAAGRGLVPVKGEDVGDAARLPLMRAYTIVRDLALTRRCLTLPEGEWEALLQKTADEKI